MGDGSCFVLFVEVLEILKDVTKATVERRAHVCVSVGDFFLQFVNVWLAVVLDQLKESRVVQEDRQPTRREPSPPLDFLLRHPRSKHHRDVMVRETKALNNRIQLAHLPRTSISAELPPSLDRESP